MSVPDLTLRRTTWHAITDASPRLPFARFNDAILVVKSLGPQVVFSVQERPERHEIEELIAWLRQIQAEVGT